MSKPAFPDYAAEDACLLIGRHINARRRLQGLTQAQVAQRAGLSRQAVIRLEAGDAGTTLDTALRVLGALHVLDVVTNALDPLNSAAGAARAEELLPQRVRPRKAT